MYSYKQEKITDETHDLSYFFSLCLSNSKQLMSLSLDPREIMDILKFKQLESCNYNHQILTLSTIEKILKKSITFDEAIEKIIPTICQSFNWQAGGFWTLDKHSKSLRCQNFWHEASAKLIELKLISQALILTPGIGLPGYVWQSKNPLFIEDISQYKTSPRKLHAIAAKLKGALAVPIKHNNQVIGVLEFFSHKTLQLENGLSEKMTNISSTISQYCLYQIEEKLIVKQTQISEKLKSILDRMNDSVIFVDNKHNVLFLNKSAQQMFGEQSIPLFMEDWHQYFDFYQPDEVILTSFSVNELPLMQAIQGEEVNDVEMFLRHINTSKGFWINVNSRPLQDPNGLLQGSIIICRNITKQKQAEEKLLRNAFYDELTGLPNRNLLLKYLEQAIILAKQKNNYSFAVLFLDLDRFKVINDSLGHIVGDQLLIEVSQRLKTCLRSRDKITRFGGDEFAILLDNIKDINCVTQVAQRIYQGLILPFNLDGQEVFVDVSIGIVINTIDYERPEDLLRDADTAMYQAKRLGKSRYQVFDQTMHIRAVKLLQIESDLRRAIERQEFKLHYQPIVSLQTKRVIGFEALVRWEHPERGLIAPSDFIPIAEENGLIVPIGYWVMREACSQMRTWQIKFPQIDLEKMSVNISGKQFSQPDLIEKIQQILQQTGLDGHRLKLEITESVLVENPESTVVMLEQLQTLGIELSMDDFGTGYSSLSCLSRFPISTLKIDRSFVNSVEVSSEKLAIIETVVALANVLGMDVVAEGVETENQLTLLKALKCKSGQGYLFAKPLDKQAAEDLITEELSS